MYNYKFLKIFRIIPGLIILSFAITGCRNNVNSNKIDNNIESSSIDIIEENNDLTEEEFLKEELEKLDTIVKSIVDKDTYNIGDNLQLTISNVGENYTIELGKPYKLEKIDGVNLIEIPLDTMFTTEMIIIEPEQDFTQEISLENLEIGTYRISKDIHLIRNESKDEGPILKSLETDFHIE